ncbi:unnamed protein product, partial [Meganyctiphanes norvegica]
MSNYGGLVGEICRFCGVDLPADTVSVMAHINSHWRQVNLESLQLSPCAFEPHVDIRVGNTPLNPEDHEVSAHMEQSFHYTYSPQTEPSNLSVAAPRCSPLNLTGRPKSDSPLSPISHPPLPATPLPISHPQIPPHAHHQEQLFCSGHLYIPPASHTHGNYSLGLINNPQGLISHPQLHGHEDMLSESCRRKRRFERFEMRCTTCDRTFFTRGSYDEHLQCHLKETNSFILSENMGQTQNFQQNVLSSCALTEKPYKCSICDQEFSYKEELLEHCEHHESAKPYKCDICGLGLSHISALRRHRLAHTGYKPHVCEICNRSFFQKCDLQRHYATHNKSKQYECNNCKKKYSSLHFLENHKCKPPQEEKPFKCNICGEGCANNMAWSYHMWKHTKNPIFVPFQEKFSIQ